MSKTTWYLIFFLLVLVVMLYAIKTFIMKQLFLKPVDAPVTSKFGPRAAPVPGASTMHNGIDIGAPTGTPIKAPLDGTVLSIYTDNTYGGGNTIVLKHEIAGQVWKTGYAHLSKYGDFKNGDKVKQGDIIGYVGATGRVSGPHLHFTLTNPKGVKVDPLAYLNKPLVSLA